MRKARTHPEKEGIAVQGVALIFPDINSFNVHVMYRVP
jgi:hypothetical protein